MRIHSSLVFRLTVFLSISLFFIWLVSVVTTVFFSLNNAHQHVMDELSNLANLRAELSNHRFVGGEKDAHDLARRYNIFYENHEYEKNIPSKNDSRFLPINSNICYLDRTISQDNWFIQAYGAAGQTYYLDSFIFKRSQGISIYPPEKITGDYFAKRRLELASFQSEPTHDNIYWGKPEYISGSGWSISVAASDKTGGLVGYAIKLDDLLSYGQTVTDFDIDIWLDQQQQILPFFHGKYPAEEEAKILKALKDIQLKDGWQQIPGYQVLRTQLKGPGWQQLVIYPNRGMFEEIAEQARTQLPFALGILLLITLALFGMLRCYLARPLWQFVDVICKTSPENFYPRLLENRQDELGQIAVAYNRLLDTLNQQYATLEKKVAERTRALTEAKQQAELANKRKSRHLTAISHELRTPLNGILGALELLKAGGMDKQQLWLADTAHQCTRTLLGIINKLLDFSRIEAGQIELQCALCQLFPMLDQAMLTVQGMAQSKGLALKVHLAENVPNHVSLDALRVQQILVNLLANACKFTDQGGISLTVERTGNTLVLTVDDSGCGVSEENINAVFVPFYQVQAHAQGTGLGLTIASNLAKMMGGQLVFNSILGQGSRVVFKLPLAEFSEPEPLRGEIFAPVALHPQLMAWGVSCLTGAPSDELSNSDLQFLPGRLNEITKRLLVGITPSVKDVVPLQPWRMRVLLVDDILTNREIIGEMLKRLGQQVYLAENREQALQLGRLYRFDLVLMDILLPGSDGLEVTRLWRNDAQVQDTDCMIVALSANTKTEEKERAIHAGMNDYLSKPVTLSDLSQMLELTAEYQLRRNITLILQKDPGEPMLPMAVSPVRKKVCDELCRLLDGAEQHDYQRESMNRLMHTMKGLCGQAGLQAAVDLIVEMEFQMLSGLIPQQKTLFLLRQLIHSLSDSHFEHQ
ncbi:MAG: two component system sensor kinase [Serratia liquefaciens]|nr:two component system sensor kinase [Serratia liquefaciens]